ncbi:MAG: tetratricopeptide repeat protein [Acidobacteria bacterium]|nr:tetratricopeptide repeat protein [Acidobacteriota bacterium]
MKLNIRRATIALAALGLLLSTAGCNRLRSRDNLNKGVREYKGAKFAEAVKYFQQAIELDPDFTTARLYLATAYMSQWIPGADSEENNKYAKAAEDNFRQVLDKDPNDKLAIASIGSIYYNQKKFDTAKEWNERLLKVDPQNKEALYTLGVIAWGKAYPVRGEARAKLSMRPEDPGPIKDKKVRAEVKAKNFAIVQDGIVSLEKAIKIDSNYDDALAYLNLMHRELADLADSSDEYKKEIAMADDFVQKTLDAKKRKAEEAEKKAAQGIKNDLK